MGTHAILAVLAVCLSAGAAQADWTSKKEINDFDRSVVAFAVASSDNGNILGVRCDGSRPEAVKIVFVTPERARDDGSGLNILRPKLSLIVDGGDRIDLPAGFDVVDIGLVSRVRVVAEGVASLDAAEKIARAKRRIAVAVEFLGETHYPSVVGVHGSSRHIAGVLKSCGVASPGGGSSQ